MKNDLALAANEKVINLSRLHYIVVLQYVAIGILISAGTLLFGKDLLPENFLLIVAVFLLFGLVYVGFLAYKKTAVILTTNRLIYFDTEGLLNRSKKEIPISNIKAFNLEKVNPIGHLLNFGTLKIQVPDGEFSEMFIDHIASPEKLNNALSDLLSNKNDQFEPDLPSEEINIETNPTAGDYAVLVLALCVLAGVTYFVFRMIYYNTPLGGYFQPLLNLFN